ncbi:hypothetical protein Mapa_002244 [Marchantia paleacea]|nr:hypothetical protein Mapa_002244 [Marchantia paleacea]
MSTKPNPNSVQHRITRKITWVSIKLRVPNFFIMDVPLSLCTLEHVSGKKNGNISLDSSFSFLLFFFHLRTLTAKYVDVEIDESRQQQRQLNIHQGLIAHGTCKRICIASDFASRAEGNAYMKSLPPHYSAFKNQQQPQPCQNPPRRKRIHSILLAPRDSQ